MIALFSQLASLIDLLKISDICAIYDLREGFSYQFMIIKEKPPLSFWFRRQCKARSNCYMRFFFYDRKVFTLTLNTSLHKTVETDLSILWYSSTDRRGD